MGSVTPINQKTVDRFEALSVVLHSLLEQTVEDKILGQYQLPDNVEEKDGAAFYEGLMCAFGMLHELVHALKDGPAEYTEDQLNAVIDKLSEDSDE